MKKVTLIILFSIFLILNHKLQAEILSNNIINTYNILADTHLAFKNISLNRKKLLPDFGVFNVLLISEHVDRRTPLYKIISQLNIDNKHKKKILENITDGILKIYFDLGRSKKVWLNNYKVFENELKQFQDKRLTKPPDFIILSHAHWTNYLGGIEYIQKKYPYVPIFITPDMKKGLICFNYDKNDSFNWKKFKNGKILKIKNPIILTPGVTILTKHLAIITQRFRHKWENLSLQNGKISINTFKPYPEYENILILNTKNGLAMFTTCMHSSFLNAIRKANNLYHKDVYLYSGGFEEEADVIPKAKRIFPSLRFLFYHCAPVEKLISIFGNSYIKRIKLGQKIKFELD